MELQISRSESEIMSIIWQSGGKITVGPLLEKLAVIGRSWKSNTVVTFLARLAEKGLLTVEKSGRFNTYIAVFTEADFRERQTRSFLEKMYDGNAKELVASLLRQECLSPADIEELTVFWKKGGDGNE